MTTGTATPPKPQGSNSSAYYYKKVSEDVNIVRKLIAADSTLLSSATTRTTTPSPSSPPSRTLPPLPAPVLQAAISSLKSANVDVLQQGIQVVKLSTRGVWNKRVVTLSSDKFAFFITHDVLPGATARSGDAATAAETTGLRSYTAKKTLPIPLWTPSHGFRWLSSKSASIGSDSQSYTRYLDIADIDGWQVGLVGTQILEYVHRSVNGAGSNSSSNDSNVDDIVTIFHGGFQKTLNLLIKNKNHRQALIDVLRQLKSTYNTVVPYVDKEQLLLRYVYYDIDIDANGCVNSNEFNAICKRINLDLNKKDRGQIFKQYLEDIKEQRQQQQGKNMKSNELTSSETQQLMSAISSKGSPAHELWENMFGEQTKTVDKAQFCDKFLVSCQGDVQLSPTEMETLLDSLSLFTGQGSTKSLSSKSEISKTQFVNFLYSDLNSAYDPKATAKWPTGHGPRLNKPLSYYWINTSHNTYLMGDQLQSRSTVEAYMKALYRGCKCLELDCWDGDDGGKKNRRNQTYTPVVFHGHTLTSKIEFRSICLAVKNYLDANPETYPIILSLESHCSHPYQRTMASDMKEIFGKKLFVPSAQQTSGGTLPSPEELRGMVVIKGKRPPDADEDGPVSKGPTERGSIRNQTSSADDDDDIDQYDAARTKGAKSKIDPELANLTLFHGTKYKNFNDSIKLNPSHMHSIGESKIKKIVSKKNAAKMWKKYNVQHMTRTYPAGGRIDSSNYNPVLAWAMGCQLVALNFQTSDAPLVLNDGMFRQAGGCGYVEKPRSVMTGVPPEKKTVRIQVLSAQCLPKPNGVKSGETIDPYIQIDLHDVRVFDEGQKEEYVTSSFATSSIDNNGFCPVWKDAKTKFEVCNPDVAFLLVKIVDEDWDLDDMIASCSIPVSKLRKGYRSIVLYNQNGTRSGHFQSATVLVKIEY